MPYIDPSKRQQYDEILDQLKAIVTKGDLEYCCFRLGKIYMQNRNQCYSDLHDASYGIIHAGEEFKRRYLDVREDFAKEKNGDIK